MSRDDEHYGTLYDFLIAEFTPDEFLIFLRSYPGGRELALGLPAPTVAPNKYFAAAAELLLRHRIVLEHRFWRRMLRRYPHKARSIRKTAAIFVGLLDPDNRPVLEPPLSEWIAEHWRVLAVLFLGPATVAGVVWWGQSSGSGPVSLAQICRITMYGWQALFTAAVVVVFAGWAEPGSSLLFRRSDSEKNLSEHMWDDRLLEDPDSRSALGFGAGNEDPIQPWRDAAQHARTQVVRSWIFLFFAWALLSVALIGFEFLMKAPDPGALPTLIQARSTLVRFLNDLASVALAACYWILTFVTVRFTRAGQPEQRPWFGVAGLVGFMVAAVVAIIHTFALLDPLNGIETRLAIDLAFSLLSGLAAAMFTALLIGRLDSALIGVRWWVLGLLYLYAAIQPCFSINRLLFETIQWQGAPPALKEALETTTIGRLHLAVQLGLQAFALLAKYALFIVFAWIYHTGRLDFYLLRLRRLHGQLGNDWGYVTSSGALPTPRHDPSPAKQDG